MTFAWTVYQCPRCDCALRDLRCASGNTFGGEFWSDGYSDYPMLHQELDLQRCPACQGFFWMREIGEMTYLSDDEVNGDRLNNSSGVIKPKGHELWLALQQATPEAGNEGNQRWTDEDLRNARRAFLWEQNRYPRALARHHAYSRRRDAGKLRYDESRINESEDCQKFASMPETESWNRSSKFSTAIRIGNETEARRIFAIDCPPPHGSEFRENLKLLENLLDPEIPEQRLELAEIARELEDFDTALKLLNVASWPDELASAAAKIGEQASRKESVVFCFNPEEL